MEALWTRVAPVLVCIGLGAGWPGWGVDAPPGPEGFTSSTRVDIALDVERTSRAVWGSLYLIPGSIIIADGTPTSGPSGGKVMLYGDRSDPLLNGETDWQMTPRPTIVIIDPQQIPKPYDFPFGPPCPRPSQQWYWTQVYGYTAILHRENGTTSSASAKLEVDDSFE